jgi:hypothetical protein
MNIGLLLPAQTIKHGKKTFHGLNGFLRSLLLKPAPFMEGLRLVVCLLPYSSSEIQTNHGLRNKVLARLSSFFEERNIWPVLEHPDIMGLCQPSGHLYQKVLTEVAVNRFVEVLKLVRGIGELSSREILVTGGSKYLEFAISRLITKVKAMNILIPEGISAPAEAEKAFSETGIPVHITNDYDILKRNRVWLRFPDDPECFDILPEKFNGVIVDFGAMKIIDTKNRKIFTVIVEFSDKIKRRIGQQILNSLEKGALEGFIVAVCANAWDISIAEASALLDMRLSFQA